jgi:Dolichyl-phosphate-mannose-protein mannosyltransferase
MAITTDTVAARPVSSGPMLYVSLLVELLRSRPELLFWTATLSQAFLWVFVPTLTYSAPPGNVPLVLAAGHEWVAGSRLGPPLANWLAEIAFDLCGRHLFGIYLLSQICVVTTFWAVFALGRSIVGAQHAVMAVLLMTGIIAFSLPTPEFGPHVLAMPLSALSLLHYWRAVGERRPRYWLALGLDIGLLLLTTYVGLILVGLLAAFTAATPQGRRSFEHLEPWLGGIITVLIVFPHLMWIDRTGATAAEPIRQASRLLVAAAHLGTGLQLLGWLVAFHAGALVLLALAGGVRVDPRTPAPSFERRPVSPFAKRFVYTFAIAPALIGTLLSVLLGRAAPIGGVGALVIVSALGLIVAAGDVIRLHRQTILGRVWLAILLVPPATVIGTSILLPWTLAIAFDVNRPAAAIAEFFTDTFHRRTGVALRIVAGEAEVAGLVAMSSSDRPSLFLPARPQLTPWVGDADIREHGAILVWEVTDNTGAPPPVIKARFPDLVPEVPRAFERPLQGRLPLYRIGWAMIRPQPAQTAPGK